MRGLIIKKKWLDLILDGKKNWEIRGSDTKIRGRIYLIESGSGLIRGKVNLVESFPVDFPKLKENLHKHHVPYLAIGLMNYKKPHAWVLDKAERYLHPVPYTHPKGAIIWVRLKEIGEE